MAYQSIGIGTTADDGTGDSLRIGADKVNDNFSEIYTLLGTGSALTSGLSATASVVTLGSAVLTTPTISGAVSGTQTSATNTTLTNTDNQNKNQHFLPMINYKSRIEKHPNRSKK